MKKIKLFKDNYKSNYKLGLKGLWKYDEWLSKNFVVLDENF